MNALAFLGIETNAPEFSPFFASFQCLFGGCLSKTMYMAVSSANSLTLDLT